MILSRPAARGRTQDRLWAPCKRGRLRFARNSRALPAWKEIQLHKTVTGTNELAAARLDRVDN
jgi:hypothetical protein